MAVHDDETDWSPRKKAPPVLSEQGHAMVSARWHSVYGAVVAALVLKAQNSGSTPNYHKIIGEARGIATQAGETWWEVLDDD